jgi:hypothetical protein
MPGLLIFTWHGLKSTLHCGDINRRTAKRLGMILHREPQPTLATNGSFWLSNRAYGINCTHIIRRECLLSPTESAAILGRRLTLLVAGALASRLGIGPMIDWQDFTQTIGGLTPTGHPRELMTLNRMKIIN